MRVKAILLTAAALATLGACSSETPGASTGTPGATGTPAGAQGGKTDGNRDSCLTGTWRVDVDDLSKQIAARIGSGAVGSGSGSLTVSFADQMKVAYGNTVAVDMPMSGMTAKMQIVFSGDAVSSDWTAKNGKLIGNMDSNNVKTDMKATVNGQTMPVPTSLPFDGALNMTSALDYTCSGNNATIAGSGVTWKMTK